MIEVKFNKETNKAEIYESNNLLSEIESLERLVNLLPLTFIMIQADVISDIEKNGINVSKSTNKILSEKKLDESIIKLVSCIIEKSFIEVCNQKRKELNLV